MGAIAGIIDWTRGASREHLSGMLSVMRHRGTNVAMDIGGTAALGQRTSSASIVRRCVGDRDYIVLLDGELCDKEALALSLNVDPADDAALILRAYLEYGVGFPRVLKGMFAIAVWDGASRRLTLARDRFGTKPLFFCQKDGLFCFSSEIKGLLAHPSIHPTIDLEGIHEMFAFLPARTPGYGVFRGIDELLPAHTHTLERDCSVESAYWRLGYREHLDNAAETADKIRAMLTRSTLARTDGASMLSGGLDSSILSAIAASTGSVSTYSVDYEENARYFSRNLFQPDPDDEFISVMTRAIGGKHTRVMLKPVDLAASLEEAVTLRDLPGMADIDSSLLLFCREIAKDHRSVLSGEGADEIFGGYPWFYRKELAVRDRFPWSPDMQYRQSFLSGEYRGIVNLEEYARGKLHTSMMTAPEYGGSDSSEARSRNLLYLNMCWFMPNLIERSERMSTAAGISIRMPFACEDLLDYVFNIPWGMKFLGGCEKGILRKAFEGVLPDKVLHRKKSPYPKTWHPAYADAAKALLRDEMHAGSPLLHLVNEAALRALLAEAEIGRPWYGQLMAAPQLIGFMAQLGMWLRKYDVKILA